MKIFKAVSSLERPKELDENSSSTATYVNSNIVESVDEETNITLYTYDSTVYTKQEYAEIKLKELREAMNPTIDEVNCTLEEAIAFQRNKLSKDCSTLITSGIDITTSLSNEHFSLTITDQTNIKTQLDNILSLGLTSVAYHSDGNVCRMYSANEFIKIYFESQKFILEQTTYCNYLLNEYLPSLTTKEEVFNIKYGDELPKAMANTVTSLVSSQLSVFISSMEKTYNISLS